MRSDTVLRPIANHALRFRFRQRFFRFRNNSVLLILDPDGLCRILESKVVVRINAMIHSFRSDDRCRVCSVHRHSINPQPSRPNSSWFPFVDRTSDIYRRNISSEVGWISFNIDAERTANDNLTLVFVSVSSPCISLRSEGEKRRNFTCSTGKKNDSERNKINW